MVALCAAFVVSRFGLTGCYTLCVVLDKIEIRSRKIRLILCYICDSEF